MKHKIINYKYIQNESGLTVKELLRTLAVMAVVLLIGWWVYAFFMMRHHCDNIIDELKFLSNDFSVRIQQLPSVPEEGISLEKGTVMKSGNYYTAKGYADHFEISVRGLSPRECDTLVNWGWPLPYKITPKMSDGNCELLFAFRNDLIVQTGASSEGCSSFGYWSGEKCICQEGYIGAKCDKCDVKAGYDSQDSQGKCYISSKRDACTVDSFCNGHATAAEFDSYCSCQKCLMGYYGEHCEQFDSSGDVCNGNGKEPYWFNAPVLSGKGGGCDCKDGFYGRRCDLTKEADECSGHGSIYGFGTCECDEGYAGFDCEYTAESAVCGTSHYAPQGQRIYLNEQSFCACNRGYFGENCTRKCLNACKSGYQVYKDGSCRCECYNGYYGADCSQRCTNTCNYGFAVYKNDSCGCECYEGYYGKLCNQKCSNQINCANGGKAVYKDGACQCVCPENAFGKLCEHNCADEIKCPANSVAFYGKGQCLCSSVDTKKQ